MRTRSSRDAAARITNRDYPGLGPSALQTLGITTDPEGRLWITVNQRVNNAQATVEVGSRVIVGERVTAAPNDKQELPATVAAIAPVAGPVAAVLVDSGFYSEPAVQKVEQTPKNAPPSEDRRRQKALQAAAADDRAGVRDHKVGDGFPAVPVTGNRQSIHRVETRTRMSGLRRESPARLWASRARENRDASAAIQPRIARILTDEIFSAASV